MIPTPEEVRIQESGEEMNLHTISTLYPFIGVFDIKKEAGLDGPFGQTWEKSIVQIR